RATPDAGPAGRTAIRSKPVRITLDLSPELYRQLTAWGDSAAVTLDVPRVSLADAVRAMIRVAADNPDDVLDRLRRDRDQSRSRDGGVGSTARAAAGMRGGGPVWREACVARGAAGFGWRAWPGLSWRA